LYIPQIKMGNANGTGKGKVAQLKQQQIDQYVDTTNCKLTQGQVSITRVI
jgi:hypothetical protein